MGQRANNGGRQATLDEKKVRAAGRQKNPLRGRDQDFGAPAGNRQVKGAFGRRTTNRRTGAA
jgi:hypothetical protein